MRRQLKQKLMKQIIRTLQVILLVLSITSCKNEKMKIENFKKYSIRTPDETSINFLKIPYKSASEFLKEYNYEEKSLSRGLTTHKIYKFYNGMQLFEATLDSSYYFLFLNEMESHNYFSGETYWKTNVHFHYYQNVH
jgi:hypothetical protein